MAIGAGTAPLVGFQSPDSSVKEDVSDILYQPTPEDTPLYDMMGDKGAQGIFHYWLTRSLLNYQTNAQPEGFVYQYTGQIQYPDARWVNETQIFGRSVRVSESAAATQHWAIDDYVNDQINAAVTGCKTDVEFALHQGVCATGLTGTARQLTGILQFLTSGITSYTNVTGAVSLSETIFNDCVTLAWVLGGHPSDAFVGGYFKRRISGFTAGSQTRTILAEDMKLVNSVQLYVSDFNMTIAIHPDRNMPVQGSTAALSSTGYSFLLLDKTVCEKAFLRRWVIERTPKVADSFDAIVKSELTGEWGHPVFHALRLQYL